MSQTITKLSNLINPQVMGAFLDKKIIDMIKFAPLAVIGHDLQGQPGNTLTIPTWNYVGDAKDLAEGVEGDVEHLTATSTQVTVKKAVKNIGITDEARLSGYGDPMGQIEHQLAVSIASKVDNDVLASLKTASVEVQAKGFSKEVIVDALVKFGEDVEQTSYVLLNAVNYAILRKDPDFVHIANGQAVISGQVGTLYGCPIVVTNKLEDTEVYIVRVGALGIEIKREVNVEVERQVLKKQTIVSADRHYCTYLRDASKAVKVTISPAEEMKVTRGKATTK